MNAPKHIWILLCVDVGSNYFLVDAAALMHNAKQCDRVVNGTGGGKDKVTAVGELRAIFHSSLRSIKLTIERCHAMLSNKHYTLGLAPFLQEECNKEIHKMHDNATLKLNVEETFIHVSVISD